MWGYPRHLFFEAYDALRASIGTRKDVPKESFRKNIEKRSGNLAKGTGLKFA